MILKIFFLSLTISFWGYIISMLLFIGINKVRPGTFPPAFSQPYFYEKLFIIFLFSITFFLYKHTTKLLKELPAELLQINKGPIQKRRIDLNISYDDAFVACVNSLHNIESLRNIVQEKKKGIINALVRGWSMKGSIIKFEITRISDIITQVDLKVRPVWKTVIFDDFVNLKIAESIFRFLKMYEKQ